MRAQRFRVYLTALVLSSFFSAGFAATVDNTSGRTPIGRVSNDAPLSFVENQGQWPSQVAYRASIPGGAIWITNSDVVYQLVRTPANPADRSLAVQPECQSMRFSSRMVNTTGEAVVAGEGEVSHNFNFFLGNDPARWATNVASYESVVVTNIYPGIDLTYYGNRGLLEYDLRVSPGADYRQIQVEYSGIRGLSLGSGGELTITTDWGNVRELAPVVYQELAGQRVYIAGKYVFVGDDRVGFALSSEYDPTLPVTIDPILVYSTFLGGSDEDYGEAIAVDTTGCAYVVGYTGSLDFPTANPIQTTATWDAFVTKFCPEGDSLIYSTYIGGGQLDIAWGIAVDDSGNAYITGETGSSDFPTVNPYQTDQPYADVFVTKLNPHGDGLVYSTYVGGGNDEIATDIALDQTGAVWVCGWTASNDFPTVSPFQTDMWTNDGIVFKLSADGQTMLFGTYLGGNDREEVSGIAVDTFGSAYVTGYTSSTDFPTVTPIQSDLPDGDAYVTKFPPSGGSPVYSTYIGGSLFDSGKDIVVDNAGHAYITGYTASTDFPTVNYYQLDQGLDDAFVVRLSVIGRSIDFSTYLGGGSYDEGWGITLDKLGCVYVAGRTRSSSFPTMFAFQPTIGSQPGWDAFVTKLNSGFNPMFSSFLGGMDYDGAWGIATMASKGAYVVGQTMSPDFPMVNAYQTMPTPYYATAFVTRIEATDFICGDIDNDGEVSIGDVTYIVVYMFKSGPPPDYMHCANVNLIGDIDIADLTFLVNYMFKAGPALNCPQ